MICRQNNRVREHEQYETMHPLAFPWNDQTAQDVPRYIKGDDGWWFNPAAKDSGKALLSCAGDLMCEPRLTRANRYGDFYFFQPMYQYVRSIFKSSDFSIGNLETTITEMSPYAGTYHNVARTYHCNGPICYLDALRYAGFDAFVNANNHNCDSGVAGMIDTNENIDSHGFMRTGTFIPGRDNRALLVKINGIKVAILSYATAFNKLDKYYTELGKNTVLNEFSPEKAVADVAWAKAHGAEYVLSYIHWGKSYVHYPTDVQREQAQQLADAGVDYIVGSHSHCLQINDKIAAADGRSVPVIFSMGNFVTNESQDLCRHCGILQVQLTKTERGIAVKDYFMPCFVFDEFGTGRFTCVPVDTLHNGGYDHPELHRSRTFAAELVKIPEPASGAMTVSELCGILEIPVPEGMEYTSFSKVTVQAKITEERMLYFASGEETDFELLQIRRRRPIFVVTEKPLEGYSCLVVPDVKAAYRKVCDVIRSRFDAKFVVVAGGSGKTVTRGLIADVLHCGYRVHTHADGVQIDTGAWRDLHPSHEYCVQEVRPDFRMGYRMASEILKPEICVITSDTDRAEDLAAGIPDGGLLLYNGNDAALRVKMEKLNCGRIRVQAYGKAACSGLRTEEAAGAALAVGQEVGLSRTVCEAAVNAWNYNGFDRTILRAGEVTVLSDYACRNAEEAEVSLAALMTQNGKKIAVVESSYAQIAQQAGADIVIACETPDEDRAVRFAAERQLEDQILEAMEPGCAVALCGGRYMDFNVTLRRLFGFTDGVITDVW